jgi:hypothetical protein
MSQSKSPIRRPYRNRRCRDRRHRIGRTLGFHAGAIARHGGTSDQADEDGAANPVSVFKPNAWSTESVGYPAGGLTLGLFAASVLLHSTPPGEPVRSDTPAVARPITAEPPAEVAAQTDQVQVPSAPTAQMTTREPERQVAKLRAHRTWSATVRKTHLLLSRRGSSMFEPMTWHGGGY